MLNFIKLVLIWTAVGSTAYVLTVNYAVRTIGGGYPHLASVYYLPEKTSALIQCLWHLTKHPLQKPHPEPRALLKRSANKYRLPADFVIAIALAESELKPHRISATGAMGIMQLMPETAQHLKISNPFDSHENIDGGVRYLRYLWRRYKGDKKRTAAAYNAGPGNVARKGKLTLPAQTRHYVRRVLASTKRSQKTNR